VAQVAVLDADEVGFVQREIEVEVDESVQRRPWVLGAGDHVGGTGQ